MTDAFGGIDVAFAKKKRLPVVVCVVVQGKLQPLPLRQLTKKPPAGRGNAKSIDDAEVDAFASETADYLQAIEAYYSVRIRRVAIDAPSDPKRDGCKRRKYECSLDERSISCITTPSAGEFEDIRVKVSGHLAAGKPQSTIPHANQFWMLAGFALFRRLRRDWECLEVFPQAITHALGANTTHKKHSVGAFTQLAAAAKHTGWPGSSNAVKMAKELADIGFGQRHDRIDAYLSAWVASLEEQDREALGRSPDDVIWIPRLRSAGQAIVH